MFIDSLCNNFTCAIFELILSIHEVEWRSERHQYNNSMVPTFVRHLSKTTTFSRFFVLTKITLKFLIIQTGNLMKTLRGAPAHIPRYQTNQLYLQKTRLVSVQ